MSDFQKNLVAAFLAFEAKDTEVEFSCLQKCMELYRGPETCSDSVITCVMERFAELAIGIALNQMIREAFPEARTVH